MKRILFLSILITIIIGFQNCSKLQLQEQQKNQASVSMNSVSATSSSYLPSSADKLSIANNLNINSTDNPEVYYYQINLTTAGISAYDFNEEVLKNKTFCLSDADLNELKSILNSSAICDKTQSSTDSNSSTDTSATNSSEKFCTAVYTEPYANLVFGENEVKLGEAKSGCDEPVDLCGDHKDLLKGFVTNLLKNISTKACSFESVTKN